MSDALTVHVNREAVHSLSAPDSFETNESFDVVLVNHGESTHVHIHLDDSLSDLAAVEAPNHHVDGGSQRRVRVARTGGGTARGNLKLVTAYGATTRYVDVQIVEQTTPDEPVEVGEDLTKPAPRDEADDQAVFADQPTLALVGVGVVVIALAGSVAALVSGSLLLAALVLVLGGAVATVLIGQGLYSTN